MTETVIDLTDRKEYIVTAQRNGENAQSCPICSLNRRKVNNKCFSYNAEKGVGRCNHCGVSLVKKKELVREVKVEYKKPTWRNNTQLSDNCIKWFEGRGISQSTLTKIKVTEGLEYMPQISKEINTIQFNYFKDGELVNTKFRDGAKRFKMVSGAELIFYNLDSVKDSKEVIIVEGEMDCLSFIEAGIENVISVPNGATRGNNNLTYLDNCIDYFSNDTIFLLALDNDFAGNNLRDELARRFGFENCKKVYFGDCKDANECLVKFGINGLIESIANAQDYPLRGVFSAVDIDEDINDFYVNGLPEGARIGVPEFDQVLSFHKGYITTITGIPSHGKSEFLDFLCAKLNILSGWKFALYSPENYPLQLHFSKIAEKMVGKKFSGTNKMNPMELELAKSHFQENFFFIKPEEDFTLDNILAMVRSLIRKKGINAFVIDAWNKLDHQYTINETQYISKELDKLALFCETNNVHLFLVAHPTKIQKDKNTGKFDIPNLYSISGSANFYNKTANGISVYRDFGDAENESSTHIYVQKVKFKHWGMIGMVKFKWSFDNGRYYVNTMDNSNWILKEFVQGTIEANTNFDNEKPQPAKTRAWYEVDPDSPF